MANKKKVDLTEVSLEELNDTLEESQARMQKMRFNQAVSVLEDSNSISRLKKEIARYKTELRRREIEAAK